MSAFPKGMLEVQRGEVRGGWLYASLARERVCVYVCVCMCRCGCSCARERERECVCMDAGAGAYDMRQDKVRLRVSLAQTNKKGWQIEVDSK